MLSITLNTLNQSVFEILRGMLMISSVTCILRSGVTANNVEKKKIIDITCWDFSIGKK